MNEQMSEIDALYQTYQPFLFSIAYRMLGTITDAEDVVQDLFLNFTPDLTQINDMKAYLAKMITNRCLNFLNSARYKREIYTGPWLPEPQVHSTEHPLDKIINDEAVSYAFLVIMEQLSPAERAIFIFREALCYSYKEIAEVIGKSEANCRKIHSRAKKKLAGQWPLSTGKAEKHNHLVKTFIKASTTGEMSELIEALSEDVIVVTDGGGKVTSALNPIYSKTNVAAFLLGISKKGAFKGKLMPVKVNDRPGILQIIDGEPSHVISFTLDKNEKYIERIYIVLNPDKLSHIAISGLS
ncbi:RNA polymerase sigma-70 factor [Halalkalibacter oceani]|uniref:RNA polymerase sigma-70 factor n=1 Tax=Halalkalibacter oceani TaxID=1653776 RepID=A0A9X2IPD0_9BACI|nr:RNA polymerase sigma-70 factor [Halalkalibacter oceani]MCM3713423.1 RNA polymerase sigma-70 factor [Halalkalibacter oceani]